MIIVKLIAKDSNYPNLQMNSTGLIIGRNQETKIKETRCAKEQVSIQIDNDQVFIEQLGANTSFVNSAPLKINEKQMLNDGDAISLLDNEFIYVVEIKSTLKRRNTDSDDGEEIVEKKQKTVTQDDDDEEEEEDEERLAWVREQLNALQSSSTTTTISKEVNPTTEDRWETPDDGLEVFTSKGVTSRDKIAGFDMDGTIILTKSGKVYPVDDNDWRIAFDTCFKKLKQLHADNFKIVLFTNQRGLMKVKSTDSFRKKIQFIQQKLNIPLQVFVAIHPGQYRKPCIGSWTLLQSKYNDGIQIDKSKSFYVGDAAGRPDKWRAKAKKDHSCADRLFAINLSLRFFTPEEYFLGLSKANYEMPKFNPTALRSIQESTSLNLPAEKIEMIVMCGLPASGKSWFAKRYIVPHQYEYVNRDELGTWQKCVKIAETKLNNNQNVVIDNTNLDIESRQRYIELAKKLQISCRCFLMNVSLDHAKHNNLFRQILGTDQAHKDVNDIVLMSSQKRFVQPTLNEGFSQILPLNFQPKFDSSRHEQLYYQYLLDK